MSNVPSSFAERMRSLMVWMLFGAGVVCTLLAVGSLLIVWVGGWPVGTEPQRLSIIGWALIGALTGMGAVIASLAIGGPVGRFKATGPGGTGVDLEAKADPPAAPTTVTTTVTTGDQQ